MFIFSLFSDHRYCLDPSKRQSGLTPLAGNGTSSKQLLLTTIPLISTTDPFQKGMGMKVAVSVAHLEHFCFTRMLIFLQTPHSPPNSDRSSHHDTSNFPLV